MISRLLQLGAVAAAVSHVAAQNANASVAAWPENVVDVGNGVHVPGAIPANLYEPLQHRLAFHGATGLTVSWSSFKQLGQPTVFFGIDPKNLNQSATSNASTTYETSRTYNNHVVLSDLAPGTKYWYQVSHTNEPGGAYRPSYTFTTARPTGDKTPFSMAVYADLGLMGPQGLTTFSGPIGGPDTTLKPYETNTIQSLNENLDTFEFAHLVGDIGYADYFIKESFQGMFGTDINSTQPTRAMVADKYEEMSEQFFDQMQPITAVRPWMVSPGNHEANCLNGNQKDKHAHITYDESYCLEGQSEFKFFREHFRMPGSLSRGLENFWYSYDYGMAHFVSLTAETDLGANLTGPIEAKPFNVTTGHVNGPFGTPNEQINFLIRDLRRVNRQKTPWVVVFVHRPWYCSSGCQPGVAWQQAFEKILYDNNVDLVMHGHVHNYEVFQPMYNGTVDPNGFNNPRAPMYVLAGNAGHYDGLDSFDDPTKRATGSVFSNDNTYGWGRLSFEDAEHLTYEHIASGNSTVIDTQKLYKKRAGGSTRNKRLVLDY
ncbi:purple acid phosphatase family protein [Sporobolomyces koalae]|uniref:purple acid phosphatase family protein n=1 Tax=Sporobolomyces koalae TaxID=500713 RepID=UPI003173AFD0